MFIIDPNTAVLRCPCHASTAAQIPTQRVDWCYLGLTPRRLLIKYVRVVVSTLAVGTPAAEVCIATGVAPNGSAITLTKLWADGTLDSMVSPAATGVKGNTAANTIWAPRGVHVYAGFRAHFTGGGSTNPQLHILQRDWGAGYLLQTAGQGALTGSSSWTATPVTFANNFSSDIRGYLN